MFKTYDGTEENEEEPIRRTRRKKERQTTMAKISRRNFMRGAAMGTMGAAAAGLLTACGNTASSTTSAPASSAASSEAASVVTKPSTPVDGKYVTKAMGHESWVHVATTFFEGKITACEVLSHEETIGIGNYACSRIPAAIVAANSPSVDAVSGATNTQPAWFLHHLHGCEGCREGGH